MTLMLQLLFDPKFKRAFTAVILKHYSRLMEEWSVKPLEAVMPLDMITVQLFNDEVRTTTQTVPMPKWVLAGGSVVADVVTGFES